MAIRKERHTKKQTVSALRASELEELRRLRKENRRLRGVVVDLTFEGAMPVGYEGVIDARAIVRQNAGDAFEVGLEPERDRRALQSFLDKTLGSGDREALLNAWQRVPELKAKGADFLTVKVFAPAAQERRWPGEPPAEVVYVLGVRDAGAAFLKGGSK